MSDKDANQEVQPDDPIPPPAWPSSPTSRIADIILRVPQGCPAALITPASSLPREPSETGSTTSTIQDDDSMDEDSMAKAILEATAPRLESLWYSFMRFSDGFIQAKSKADSEDPIEMVDLKVVWKLYPELIQKMLVVAESLKITPLGVSDFGYKTPLAILSTARTGSTSIPQPAAVVCGAFHLTEVHELLVRCRALPPDTRQLRSDDEHDPVLLPVERIVKAVLCLCSSEYESSTATQGQLLARAADLLPLVNITILQGRRKVITTHSWRTDYYTSFLDIIPYDYIRKLGNRVARLSAAVERRKLSQS